MRIIAGTAGGIKLAPVPNGVRPTSDRVRESLFNALGQFFESGEVLDLYAGTGALGIEAISRGCDRAVFVERDPRAIETIHENIRRTRFEGRAEVVRGDAGRFVEQFISKRQQFHLIFLDPPYKIGPLELNNVIERVSELLFTDGRLIVESDRPLGGAEKFKKANERRYGGTVITIYDQAELI